MDHTSLIESLLAEPYLIVDILPEQVPADSEGQYFAADRYFRQPPRLNDLYRKFAEIILRLNCYYDMAVSFDLSESPEKNPEPEKFAERLSALSGNEFCRVLFPTRDSMIDIAPGDTYMTVYCRDHGLEEKIRKLAEAGGLFVWQPDE